MWAVRVRPPAPNGRADGPASPVPYDPLDTDGLAEPSLQVYIQYQIDSTSSHTRYFLLYLNPSAVRESTTHSRTNGICLVLAPLDFTLRCSFGHYRIHPLRWEMQASALESGRPTGTNRLMTVFTPATSVVVSYVRTGTIQVSDTPHSVFECAICSDILSNWWPSVGRVTLKYTYCPESRLSGPKVY
jgi:hypothetical protein